LADALLPLVAGMLAAGPVAGAGTRDALAVGACGAALLGLAFLGRGRGRVVATATALGLLAGALTGGARLALPAADHLARQVGKGVAAVEGVVVRGERKGERQVLTVRAEQMRDLGGTRAVRGLLGVTIAHAHGDWPAGARVRVVGRLRRPRNFGNPGGYDYVGALARAGVLVTCFLWDEQSIELLAPPPPGPAAVLQHARAAVRRRIAAVARGRVAGYLDAVVLGEPGGLDAETRRTLARTGLAHVASVSGFHVAVVAGAALLAARSIVRSLPWVLLWCDARKLSALLGLGPVLLYAGLAGGHVPATRALLMFAVLLAALLLDRPADGLRALATAAGVLALRAPDIAADVSFELSFASVAAIVLTARRTVWPEARGREGPPRRSLVGRWVLGPMRVTVAAVLATAPLTARHFRQVSLIAPLANVVALPLLGPATLLPALAALPLVAVLPRVADVLLAVAARAAGVGLATADLLARLPAAAVATPMPSLVEIALCYAALVLPFVPSGGTPRTSSQASRAPRRGGRTITRAVARASLMERARPVGGPDAGGDGGVARGLVHAVRRRPRRWLAAAVVLAALADGGFWTYERFLDSTLRVTFLSVGQGDAAVVELPRGRVMVVDGGGLPGAFDPGERIVAPFLWARKVMRVDVVVLSHPQLDHYEGLAYLAEHFRPREFWWSGARATGARFARLEAALSRAGTRRVVVGAGTPARVLAGVRVEVLHPPADAGLDVNDASVVLRLVYGEVSMLFSGDLERAGEERLVAHGAGLASTLLKVPHHGSATSTTAVLVRAVAPRVAVISAGYDNRFGFPAASVLERLAAAGVTTCRTDRDGAVRVVAGRGWLQVRSWNGGCAQVLDLNSPDRFGSSPGSRKPPDEEAEWREGIP
jgi:competence protein ComEC